MNTDGNTDAIERELEAQERYEAAQPGADMYCSHCDESFDESEDTCPNCSEELYEL
jgi:uncharacterized paraquat-inducible protein A